MRDNILTLKSMSLELIKIALKRQQQKEETKIKIIEAAYKVFSQNGFAATTNDIAKEIGVSHGTIFAHFPTREELISFILERFMSDTCERLHELTSRSRDLRDILNAHLTAIEEHEAFYTRFISENRILPESVRNMFISVQSTIAFHFEKIIETDKQNGSIKDLPNFYYFNLWMGLVHYYLQNNDIFAPSASVVKRYREFFIESYLETIKR